MQSVLDIKKVKYNLKKDISKISIFKQGTIKTFFNGKQQNMKISE